MPPEDKAQGPCAKVMRSLTWWRWPIILVCLALAGASVYYSLTHLTISTSRNDLISSHQPFIRLSQRIDQNFGGRDGLVVVVKNGVKERSIEFAQALAAELQRYPKRFPDLFYRLNPNNFKPWALLYLGVADLQKLTDNLASQQDLLKKLAADPRLVTFYHLVNGQIAQAMIGEVFTGFLKSQQKQELPDVSLLNATLSSLDLSLRGKQRYASPFKTFLSGSIGDLDEEGYFFTDNDRFLLFLVTQQKGSYQDEADNLALLRKVVSRVQARFPGIEAGVTGPDALESDEMSSSMRDIALATWLSLVGQMGLLIFFLHGLRRPLVEVVCLVIGLCWTFGMATLTVGHLNLLSVIFAPLMLGLGIDYGIHWFCRLEEEDSVNQGVCTPEALSCSYRQTLPGVVYAGLAAMMSFLPLAFVNFRGLSELGIIMTLGIIIMLLATLIMAPSLVAVSERCVSTGKPHKCPGEPPPFMHLEWRHPGRVVAVGSVIILLGILCLFRVRFDLNPLHLQNPKVQSVVWEQRLLKESKYSTSFGALTANSLEELVARTEALKKFPTVSHVESVLSFMPSEVMEKRPVLQKLQAILRGVDFSHPAPSASSPQELSEILRRINFKMDEAAKSLKEKKAVTKGQIEETHRLINEILSLLDQERNPSAAAPLAGFEHQFFADLRHKWGLLRGYTKSALDSPPMTMADLPKAVRERFVYGGSYLIQAFPSQDIWNFAPLKKFVDDLWRVDPNAVGDPVLLYVFTNGFRNSILWATGVAVLAIAVLLGLFYQSATMSMLALIPLWAGTALTLILMWLIDLPFNQANVLFLPLILGEGVEFGIIILTRWQLENTARAITLPASTAKGVALAALTTTVGFGSLMVSNHRGTFSLGLLATVGSLSVLLASLSLLPAFLHLVEKSLTPSHTLFSSLLGSPEPQSSLEDQVHGPESIGAGGKSS